MAWYIGGPVLGLCVIALRWLLNEPLGAVGAWSEVVERASERSFALGTRGWLLVGAMNPCPCGFAGDDRRACRCTPVQVAKYQSRLSGPLRDRIDLIVDVPAVPVGAIVDGDAGESSASVRERVIAARRRQHARYGDGHPRTNAALRGSRVATFCRTDSKGRLLLRRAVDRLGLSARGYDRVLKVARTVADLAGDEGITSDHVAEALQFR